MNRAAAHYITLCAAAALLLSTTSANADGLCTYDTYQWNVETKSAVNRKRVSKPYSEVTNEERDATTGCTVCQEDMASVQIGDLPPVLLCKAIADDVEQALNAALANGGVIHSLTAYRVGMTRGDLDENGNRTRFSNHSFGVAIDVNEDMNGLYENCIVWSEDCRLRKGGPWRPDRPGGLSAEHPIVVEMKDAGMKWGGEIAGRQKDFMHFSPTGY